MDLRQGGFHGAHGRHIGRGRRSEQVHLQLILARAFFQRGIQVAKLAGVPAAVLHHARHTLAALEERAGEDDLQVDLFAPPPAPEVQAASPVEAALAQINPDALSPREALDALYQLKRLAP